MELFEKKVESRLLDCPEKCLEGCFSLKISVVLSLQYHSYSFFPPLNSFGLWFLSLIINLFHFT